MERAYWGAINFLHLSLDTIVAAVFYQLPHRSLQLRRNEAPYLLRGIICELYGMEKGSLWSTQVSASQSALASDLGGSRQRTNELIPCLATAGWLRYHAPRLPDGHFEVGFFKIGPKLQRLLCSVLSFHRAQFRFNSPRQ